MIFFEPVTWDYWPVGFTEPPGMCVCMCVYLYLFERERRLRLSSLGGIEYANSSVLSYHIYCLGVDVELASLSLSLSLPPIPFLSLKRTHSLSLTFSFIMASTASRFAYMIHSHTVKYTGTFLFFFLSKPLPSLSPFFLSLPFFLSPSFSPYLSFSFKIPRKSSFNPDICNGRDGLCVMERRKECFHCERRTDSD